ncbi:MAG: hypothetical protein U1D36_07530 [Hydrogenophaga sp.]|jgi:hypothetical protein|nr:hypothetical protein [Hydrogenophaga sp.]MDP2407324.1 hypothetical protein [Hydrogenophaga sp.]MDZ4174307.1 hypothetical protein [Hydrogenophaga sp.]
MKRIQCPVPLSALETHVNIADRLTTASLSLAVDEDAFLTKFHDHTR